MTSDQVDSMQAIAQYIGAGVIAVLAYFVRSMISDLKARSAEYDKAHAEHREKIGELRLHVAENFTTKSELSRVVDEFKRSNEAVFEKLERIEDKLDKKADKAQHA